MSVRKSTELKLTIVAAGTETAEADLSNSIQGFPDHF